MGDITITPATVAPPLVGIRDESEPATYVTDITYAYELATLMDIHRNDLARMVTLHERITALSGQVTGSDDRLDDFWAEAQRIADEAGHCRIFDDLAEALDGPRRVTSGRVCVTVTMHIDIPVDNISDYSIDQDDVRDAVYAADRYDLVVNSYDIVEEQSD
jgi:hypothetical protein